MNRFCSNNPCFFLEEKKTQTQIPLIYQNPQQFYFPQEMQIHSKLSHSEHCLKDKVGYVASPKYNTREVKRVKSQAEISFWASQQHSHNSNLDTASQKQPYFKKEIKENVNPSQFPQNLKQQTSTTKKIYFNHELSRSKQSEKQAKTATKSHISTKIYPDKNLPQSTAHFDIVPVAEYNSLLKSNMSMKKIIEEEYRPLKNCYQSLRQEQRQRQKLIMMLQNKVKQLGQKLKQQKSVSSLNYARY